mmetsp:Transcript_140549/g.199237  ORF Transcript_140549/g.199237 Transcript_140549/m.199237 type:complete len:292 (+) Transcript_140549:93-968(+)
MSLGHLMRALLLLSLAPAEALLRGGQALQDGASSFGSHGERQSVLTTQAPGGGSFLQLTGGLFRQTQGPSTPMWLMYCLLAVLVPTLLFLGCWSLAARVNSHPASASMAAFTAGHPRPTYRSKTAAATAYGAVDTAGLKLPPAMVRSAAATRLNSPERAAEQQPPPFRPSPEMRPSFRPMPTSPCPEFAPFDNGGSPEVTQYRCWADPRQPAEPIEEKDRKTVLVNFLKPPSFESPLGGLRPQTMNPKGSPSWTDPDRDSEGYNEYLDTVHRAGIAGKGKTTSMIESRARS